MYWKHPFCQPPDKFQAVPSKSRKTASNGSLHSPSVHTERQEGRRRQSTLTLFPGSSGGSAKGREARTHPRSTRNQTQTLAHSRQLLEMQATQKEMLPESLHLHRQKKKLTLTWIPHPAPPHELNTAHRFHNMGNPECSRRKTVERFQDLGLIALVSTQKDS